MKVKAADVTFRRLSPCPEYREVCVVRLAEDPVMRSFPCPLQPELKRTRAWIVVEVVR